MTIGHKFLQEFLTKKFKFASPAYDFGSEFRPEELEICLLNDKCAREKIGSYKARDWRFVRDLCLWVTVWPEGI